MGGKVLREMNDFEDHVLGNVQSLTVGRLG